MICWPWCSFMPRRAVNFIGGPFKIQVQCIKDQLRLSSGRRSDEPGGSRSLRTPEDHNHHCQSLCLLWLKELTSLNLETGPGSSLHGFTYGRLTPQDPSPGPVSRTGLQDAARRGAQRRSRGRLGSWTSG
jgi:hypothetical protein